MVIPHEASVAAAAQEEVKAQNSGKNQSLP